MTPTAPTAEQRALWAKLAEAATPGPWFSGGVPYNGLDDPDVSSTDGRWICGTVYDMQSKTVEHHVDADTLFIAASRTAVPALLSALSSVEAERDRLLERLSRLT